MPLGSVYPYIYGQSAQNARILTVLLGKRERDGLEVPNQEGCLKIYDSAGVRYRFTPRTEIAGGHCEERDPSPVIAPKVPRHAYCHPERGERHEAIARLSLPKPQGSGQAHRVLAMTSEGDLRGNDSFFRPLLSTAFHKYPHESRSP